MRLRYATEVYFRAVSYKQVLKQWILAWSNLRFKRNRACRF